MIQEKKPKLLSLHNYHYRRGGAEAVFLEHDALFRQKGWETAVFSMHHPKNEPSPWQEYFVNELEFGHQYSRWQKITMAGKVVYSWEARTKLKRLLDRFQPDIAHAHSIYHHISPSVLSLLKHQNIPVVLTAHDLKLGCPAYKMLTHDGICERCKNGNFINVVKHRCIHNSLMPSMLIAIESSVHKILNIYKKNVERVIVPSLFYKTKLIEWGWPEEKIIYIPNYIHIDKIRHQTKAGDYFFYFGRLSPEKGIDTLIQASIKAGVKLYIAGTGPYEKHLKSIANSSENIKFLGWKNQNELSTLIQLSRSTVLPSEWYENAPVSILESYANSKPVIGARIGGITELIVENETGYLFPSGSVDKLSMLLEQVNNQSDQVIIDMGHKARELVESNFTADNYFNKITSLYKTIR